jgi:hypothetical protein
MRRGNGRAAASQEGSTADDHNDDDGDDGSRPDDKLSKLPEEMTRRELVDWGRLHPKLAIKNSTKSSAIRHAIIEHEKQRVAMLKLKREEHAKFIKMRAFQKREEEKRTARTLMDRVPFLREYGHLYRLNELSKDGDLVVLESADGAGGAPQSAFAPPRQDKIINPVRCHARVNNSKSVPARLSQLVTSSSATPASSAMSDRRFALVLRNELRPLNARFNQRRVELSKRWSTILHIFTAATAWRHRLRRNKASSVIGSAWRRHQMLRRWKMMTRPAVVRGLKALREIARDHAHRRSIRIVSSFVVAADLGGFRGLIAKLRLQIVKIQRCWRGYKAITCARLCAMQIKFSLVERQHRMELMDVVKKGATLSKKELAAAQVVGEPTLSPSLYSVRQRKRLGENSHGAFGKMNDGVKEALIGVRKTSPASAGGKDCSGALVRVARLDTKLKALSERRVTTARTAKNISRVSRKQRENRRKGNLSGSLSSGLARNPPQQNTKEEKRKRKKAYSVPSHWGQYSEEPPEMLVAGDVRRQYCLQILKSARAQWILETPLKSSYSVGAFEQVTADQMQRFLAAVEEEEEENEGDGKRITIRKVVKDKPRPLRLFLHNKMKWAHILENAARLLRHEYNRKESLSRKK